jgi:hypothetical protein
VNSWDGGFSEGPPPYEESSTVAGKTNTGMAAIRKITIKCFMILLPYFCTKPDPSSERNVPGAKPGWIYIRESIIRVRSHVGKRCREFYKIIFVVILVVMT